MKMPANVPAEAALVSRLLVDPGQLATLVGQLDSSDFYDRDMSAVYGAMQRLTAMRKSVDVTTVRDEVDRHIDIPIMSLTSAHSAPLVEYAALIRRDAFRRRFIESLAKSMEKAYSEEDTGVLLADLTDTVGRIMLGIESDNLLNPDQAVDLYSKTLTRRMSGQAVGLAYGIPSLDAILQPAQGGDLVILAARPSVGKTSLAEVVSDFWSTQTPYPVLFVSIEMSLSQLLDRAVSRAANIDATKIVRGSMSEAEHDLARAAAEDRRKLGVWYSDDGWATTSTVRAAAAKVRLLAGGIGAIVVDYIGLLKDKGDNDVKRIGDISRNLKALAREFDVPLLALSQLNRAAESADEPELHHLRDSGAIEQDADAVLMMKRELGTPYLSLFVRKNRKGPIGQINLRFDAMHVKFLESMVVAV